MVHGNVLSYRRSTSARASAKENGSFGKGIGNGSIESEV